MADLPAASDLFQTDPVETRFELRGGLALLAGFFARGLQSRRLPALAGFFGRGLQSRRLPAR